jgi:hypothetical protein
MQERMRHGRVGSWNLEFAGVCAAVETETHLKLPLPITVLCDCVDFLFVMCKMRLKKTFLPICSSLPVMAGQRPSPNCPSP